MDNNILFDFELPESLKDTFMPAPSDVEFWRLAKNRTYFLDYEIDEDYRLIELSKTIIRMNIEEKDIPIDQLKPIYIYIFSYGGCLDQATALCDVIESSRIPIVTVCLGVAMSAGFLIFLAGKRRYAFRQSTFLAHQGNASFEGTADQIAEAQNNYKKQLTQMKDYILSHTKIDEKLFNKNKSRDWYITGKEEIESFGIAKVVYSFEEIQ